MPFLHALPRWCSSWTFARSSSEMTSALNSGCASYHGFEVSPFQRFFFAAGHVWGALNTSVQAPGAVHAGAGSFGARHVRVHYGDDHDDGNVLSSTTIGYQGATGDYSYYSDGGTPLNPSDD